MEKCINLFENLYVNMDQIASFEINAEQIIISTNAHPSTGTHVFFVTYDPDLPILGRTTGGILYVEMQEIHRIRRELCLFFNIDEENFSSDETL